MSQHNLFQFNILISLSKRACIADFGQATTVDSRPVVTPFPSGGLVGAMKWQAPELLLDSESEHVTQRNTTASDIYAFGMVCYEVC